MAQAEEDDLELQAREKAQRQAEQARAEGRHVGDDDHVPITVDLVSADVSVPSANQVKKYNDFLELQRFVDCLCY